VSVNKEVGPGGEDGGPSGQNGFPIGNTAHDYNFTYSFERDLVYPTTSATTIVSPPVPTRVRSRFLKLTSDEIFSIHASSQIDPVGTAIISGDFVKALDRAPTLEQKAFVHGMIYSFHTRAQSSGTKINTKKSNSLSKWLGKLGIYTEHAGYKKISKIAHALTILFSDMGPFETAGMVIGLGGGITLGSINPVKNKGGPFWMGIVGASAGMTIGKKIDEHLNINWKWVMPAY